MASWDDMVVVGRIARPHGLNGQVIVNPETDFVEERFTVGSTLVTRGTAGEETLTVRSFRVQGGRPVIAFEGLARIEDVERLAGLELRVPEESLQPLEPGSFYHHQLAGCVVELNDGTVVGEVERVEGGIGGSRLVVTGRAGEILVPLASAICVDIDIAARRIRINPPEGLLDLNDTRGSRAASGSSREGTRESREGTRESREGTRESRGGPREPRGGPRGSRGGPRGSRGGSRGGRL